MTDRFSDRIGVTKPRVELQLDSMDDALRNGLWNWVLWALDFENGNEPQKYWRKLAPSMWDSFFRRRRDSVPREVLPAVREWFLAAEWYEVYNFLEFVNARANDARLHYDLRDHLDHTLNFYLERELSGYRLVGKKIVPITSPPEIEAIREAGTPKTGFEGVAQHINSAMEMLAKKPKPDHRNSIKESISAVEAAAKLLTGEKSGGIDTALTKLAKVHPLHPAFKTSLSKLYAYTSDEGGIRHPILEATSVVTAADAKFMLVVCSAFANFLIEAGTPNP